MTSRLRKVFKRNECFCQQLIDEHLDPKRQKAEQEDIVDVLLKMMKDLEFTSDNIKAILVDIFVAGMDTSGYKILAKTLVYVDAWAIGRDTEACGQNVEEFYSERFIDSSIDYKGQDFGLIYTIWLWSENSAWEEYIGAAMVELVLANLLYRFDWEIPFRMKKEDIDFDTAPGITMHKRNALYLMAKECKY
ncbi:hypothetical protein SLEP1_g28554 [Rubroshorea leprosula]|uniref:Cytochrome P450 n=1 Tax=Rubroshorea leprosula TaxID=152421 RepID=A0AAV5K054_9ROSI|nr:hypothetical protein SLEP1_g28554 [Rubroshorea leprosula]